MSAVDDFRALVERHERVEAHNDSVPLDRIGDLQQEPRAADYRAVLDRLAGGGE